MKKNLYYICAFNYDEVIKQVNGKKWKDDRTS